MNAQGNKFNPAVALRGAALGACVGIGATLFVGHLISVTGPILVILGFHLMLSHAIVGGWIASTFVLDDQEQTPRSTAVRPLRPPTRHAHGRCGRAA